MQAATPSTARHAVWRSPAKVNLCLRVVGRRRDGYHLLDSVFVPIDRCDELAVTIDGVAPGAPTCVEVRGDHARVPADAIAKTIPPGTALGGAVRTLRRCSGA